MEQSWMQPPDRLFRLFLGNETIKGKEIDPAQSHQTIDHSGNPGHASKKKGYEVQIKKSDQSPVDGADHGNGQCKIL